MPPGAGAGAGRAPRVPGRGVRGRRGSAPGSRVADGAGVEGARVPRDAGGEGAWCGACRRPPGGRGGGGAVARRAAGAAGRDQGPTAWSRRRRRAPPGLRPRPSGDRRPAAGRHRGRREPLLLTRRPLDRLRRGRKAQESRPRRWRRRHVRGRPAVPRGKLGRRWDDPVQPRRPGGRPPPRVGRRW